MKKEVIFYSLFVAAPILITGIAFMFHIKLGICLFATTVAIIYIAITGKKYIMNNTPTKVNVDQVIDKDTNRE